MVIGIANDDECEEISGCGSGMSSYSEAKPLVVAEGLSVSVVVNVLEGTPIHDIHLSLIFPTGT